LSILVIMTPGDSIYSTVENKYLSLWRELAKQKNLEASVLLRKIKFFNMCKNYQTKKSFDYLWKLIDCVVHSSCS